MKLIHLFLSVAMLTTVGAYASSKDRKVSARDPAESAEEVTTNIQKVVENARKHLDQTGSFVFCELPDQLAENMELIFDKPYRVTHLVAVSGAKSGRVCVAIEKK